MVVELAEKAAAAEERQIGAFLILERDDVDAGRMRRVRLDSAARDLERVTDAQRAVEPAAPGHGVGVRTHQNRFRCLGVAPDHVADPVHRRGQAGRRQLAEQPTPRFDVLRRQRDAVDAGLERADARELPQIRQQPLAIDAHHLINPARTLFAKACSATGVDVAFG